MNQGKYVFSQLAEFLPQRVFDRIVSKYDGNKRVRHFTCWDQLLSMVFGQISGRESLRDLTTVLKAHQSKSYHLGLGKKVALSNLSKANAKRDYRIFEEFANHMVQLATHKNDGRDFKVEGKIYAFDSTTIDLCLGVFWWARFRKAKAGLKLHVLYEQIPVFVHFFGSSAARCQRDGFHPLRSLCLLHFDKAYIDFERLLKIDSHQAYFVVRGKST